MERSKPRYWFLGQSIDALNKRMDKIEKRMECLERMIKGDRSV